MALRFEDEAELVDSEREMEFLLEELAMLEGVSVVHRPLGAAPKGSRAGDLTSYTELILGVAGAPTLRALITLTQDWLTRRNSGTIELSVGDDTLRITSVGRTDQRLAVEGFLARAAAARTAQSADEPDEPDEAGDDDNRDD
ncbi:hypothetical protein ACFV4F_37660 [Kitasatospora sp. NPDC059722]|uniref:hypothetical protein n=1 Tax=Kitasatospora sp. NPDC059722 TaxID=3346925 RepID=UPI0036C32B04